MNCTPGMIKFRLSFVLFSALVVLTACGGSQIPVEPTVAPTITATVQVNLPTILSVEVDRNQVPHYESVELRLEIDAQYSNPYDLREVALDAVFTGPDGKDMSIPGFWDGDNAWKIRFTPSHSELHGWIQPGHLFDPSYSGRYFVHHDGTPFYGVGHADALNILIDGFDATEGVRLFDTMKAANENYVVWWPLYTNSPVNSRYDDYSVANMKVIDMVVKDAEKEGIFLIFTIWDHPPQKSTGRTHSIRQIRGMRR